jgi:hypothetical protein
MEVDDKFYEWIAQQTKKISLLVLERKASLKVGGGFYTRENQAYIGVTI